MIKDLYMSSRFLNKKAINSYLSQVKNKVGEIKTSPNFLEEFKKEKTGVNYNDDIIFNSKPLSEEFKKSHSVTEIYDNLKKNKKIDSKLLDGINLKNISSSRPTDAVLYNLSLIKYDMKNGYFQKALGGINNSLEILQESKISSYDPLAIALRLDKSFIEAHSVDNYSTLYNNIMKEIVNGYIINDPSIIVSGYMYLIKFFFYFNFYYQIPALFHLTYEVSNKNRINNVYVNDALMNSYILDQFKKGKVQKFISKHSNPAKMSVLADLRKKIEIYEVDPKKYYDLLQQLDRTIQYYLSNYPNDPSIWQFYVKRWVIETQIGREATAEHNLEQAKNFILEKLSAADSYVFNEFNRDSVYECFSYQNYFLASDFVKKNIKSTGKNNYLNLIYKCFNLPILANLKAEPREVIDKMDDFTRAHDKYFPPDVKDFKNSTMEYLKSMGYNSVIEALEDRKKKKIDELA
jgi:hypothetical protein